MSNAFHCSHRGTRVCQHTRALWQFRKHGHYTYIWPVGWSEEKKWLNSVDPGYYHRPAKTTSTERKTQETIRLWEARPQLKCFYTILYYVYYRPFYCSSQGEGRIWSTTSCFEISIPGFWTPAPTFYCWFRMAQKCGLLFGDAEFSLHVKLTIHRIESWPRHCAQG